MHPDELKKLDRIPPLSDEMTLVPKESQALLRLMAKRLDIPVHVWLDERIRALAIMERPEVFPESAASKSESLLFWAAGSRKLANIWLPAARELLLEAREERLPAPEAVFAPPLRTPVRDRVGPNRTHLLFDPRKIRAPNKKEETSVHWHKLLLDSGHEREIPQVSRTQVLAVERLRSEAPHFAEACDFVLGQLAVAHRGKRLLRLPPMLLVGPPATGKTWWSERLAHALGINSTLISMPGVTASWELSGNSASWANGQPGRLVRSLIASPLATPLILFDEIEKSSHGNYDPAPVLLHLVERMTARRWRDEFFDAEFDLSRVLIVATANHSERLDPALRSRFREIFISRPRRAELAAVVESVWANYREGHALRLPADLPVGVMEHLTDTFRDARALQRLLDEAVGRAARRPGRLALWSADFGAPAARAVAPVLHNDVMPTTREPAP